jgi:hypothetical protein
VPVLRLGSIGWLNANLLGPEEDFGDRLEHSVTYFSSKMGLPLSRTEQQNGTDRGVGKGLTFRATRIQIHKREYEQMEKVVIDDQEFEFMRCTIWHAVGLHHCFREATSSR